MKKILLLLFLVISLPASITNCKENIYKNVVIERNAEYFSFYLASYNEMKRAWEACIMSLDGENFCTFFPEENTKVIIKDGFYTAEKGMVVFHNSLLYSSIYADNFNLR